MTKLVSIDDVRPSTYNPRKADPARLKIIELSLRKLGWLLPIYADQDGEILSGHQRHLVATRMGEKEIPVCTVKRMSLNERKAINVAFNRGTNDMHHSDTPDNLQAALERVDVFELAKNMPDKEGRYPCMDAEQVSVAELVKHNKGRWISYARNLAIMLEKRGIEMPVVATRDYKIVNGIGRLENAAAKKRKTVPVVWITDEEAALSDAMLNLLSMDFDLHTRYADLLRHNSFRRARQVRKDLGWGFIFTQKRGRNTKSFDIEEPDHLAAWKKTHGSVVLDFGAGHLTETEMLRAAGVYVTPFEPYRLGEDGIINKKESIELTRAFLDDVARGVQYSSVFISSVLNSVPFQEDREHIATICGALCDDKSRLYAVALARSSHNWRNISGEHQLSERRIKECVFRLEYEPGIALGDFQSKPKVQKYHTPKEFYDLFKPHFENVQVKTKGENVTAICAKPFCIKASSLKKSIEFEFNLPYPDGSRMNLIDEAKDAFSKRLDIKL